MGSRWKGSSSANWRDRGQDSMSCRISTNICATLHARANLDRPFPKVTKPVQVGAYSRNDADGLQLDTRNMKYLRPDLNELLEQNDLQFDLTIGFENRIAYRPPDCDLDDLFEWLRKISKENSSNSGQKGGLLFPEGVNVVASRGLLARIGQTPFDPKRQRYYEFSASIHKGILFLSEVKSAQIQESELKFDATLAGYHGPKLEQYLVVANSEDSIPDTSGTVNMNEDFHGIFTSKLNNLTLLYGAELDAFDAASKNYVEIKSINQPSPGKRYELCDQSRKCLWWLQCFLVGIKTLIVAHKPEGAANHVTRLVRHETNNLKQQAEKRWEDSQRQSGWSGAVCLNFLSDVLQKARAILTETKTFNPDRSQPIFQPKSGFIDALVLNVKRKGELEVTMELVPQATHAFLKRSYFE